jgi:hypothetical protein
LTLSIEGKEEVEAEEVEGQGDEGREEDALE